MRVLLDTQVAWWMLYEPVKLRAPISAVLTDPVTELHYSPLSCAELIVKRLAGKFRFDEREFLTALGEAGAREVPLRAPHAIRTGALPPHHKDQFDRLIIAQALEENLLLISSDRVFARYDVQLLRA